MNGSAFAALMLNELRLRARRPSTLVVLLAVVLLSWWMVVDPASGEAMITVGHARVVYDSTALAAGTATLASLLMGVLGFFLLRGRSQEELRTGTAAVLAATPVSSALMLLARWAGGLVYLCGLMLALLVTMGVLHAVRGEAAFEPGVYLQMYALQLLPGLMFGAAMATLCDAWAPLMGKRGDLLYFVSWIAQLATLPASLGQHSIPGWTLVDTSGLALLPSRIEQITGQSNIEIGDGAFNAALPTIQLPAEFWTTQMVGMRLGSALLSLLPLLLALLLFHRFSPDKVRARSPGRHWLAPLAWLRRLTRPLGSALGRLLLSAARVPGLSGQVLADALLTLMAHPVVLPLWVLATVLGSFGEAARLPALLGAIVLVWGVLISDLSVRDHQSGMAAIGAAVPGGAGRRYLRQWLAALLLGLLFTGPVLLRWLLLEPQAALALLAGLVALSALANALGAITRTGRCFLALFLFGAYVSSQVRAVAWLDVVGINGAANAVSIVACLLTGLALAASGHVWQRRSGQTA